MIVKNGGKFKHFYIMHVIIVLKITIHEGAEGWVKIIRLGWI